MELTFEEHGVVFVVRMQLEELGADSAERVRAALLKGIEGHRFVLCDLSSLRFMDSSGLGVLVSLLKALRMQGELRFIGVGTQLRQILNLTGLDRVFQVDEDEAAARGALESAHARQAA
jgi:anti-sigma B factor antagonist